MPRRYYLKRGKAVKGPFSPKKLRDLITTKKLKGSDLVGVSDCGPWEQLRDTYTSLREGRYEPQSQRAASTDSRRIDYRNDEAVETVLKNAMWIANLANTFLGFAIVFMLFKHGLTGFDDNPFAPYMTFLGESLNPLGKTACVCLGQGLLFFVLHYMDDWICELFFRTLEVMPRWIVACVHVPAGGYVYIIKWIGAATVVALAGVAVVVVVGCVAVAVTTIGWSLYWLFTAPAEAVSSLMSDVVFWGAIVLAGVVALVVFICVIAGLSSSVKNVYLPIDWDGDGDNDLFLKF
jgi:hypothetical protein